MESFEGVLLTLFWLALAVRLLPKKGLENGNR